MKKPFKKAFLATLNLILLFLCLATGFKSTGSFSLFETSSDCLSQVFALTQQYARILKDNTPLYSDSSLKTVKFILPYSYFVKVIAINENSAKVVYMDDEQTAPLQEGYIKSDDLIIYDGIPENPYPKIFAKLRCDEVLFSDTSKSYPKTILTAETTVMYYGSIFENGENFYYVYADGHIGYVRKNSFTPLIIPLHPAPIEIPQDADEESDDSLNSQTEAPSQQISYMGTIRIAILVIVGILSICIIYVIFRPKNSNTKTAFTSDDEDNI